jgi:hypothetical protein
VALEDVVLAYMSRLPAGPPAQQTSREEVPA